MKRHASLLLLARSYSKPTRFPRCDATWTTLACLNNDSAILQLPGLSVWDCGHDIENPHNVPLININDDEEWLSYLDSHGHTFTNQYCWMLADVSNATSPFANVTLFGFTMADEVYTHELQYIAYHLGILRAKGVGVTICEPSIILRPSTYGLNPKENQSAL